MNIIKDGRTIDTLENYRWGFLVGGPADGEIVPEGSWEKREIEVGEETYVRKTWSSVGAPARIISFVAKMMPKECHWPYAVNRRIYSSHPELEKLPDIHINSDEKADE